MRYSKFCGFEVLLLSTPRQMNYSELGRKLSHHKIPFYFRPKYGFCKSFLPLKTPYYFPKQGIVGAQLGFRIRIRILDF